MNQPDDELRHELHALRDALAPVPPGSASAVVDRVDQRRRARAVLLATSAMTAVVTVTGLAIAVGRTGNADRTTPVVPGGSVTRTLPGGSSAAAPMGTTVPVLTTQPKASLPPLAATASASRRALTLACRTSQLRASASWEGDSIDRGRLHGLVYYVSLRNVGAGCQQAPITSVTLMSSVGPLPTTPLPLAAASHAVTIGAGKSAVLTLVWLPSYCGPALAKAPDVRILFDGSELDVPALPASTVRLPFTPSCTDAATQSRLQNLGLAVTS